MALGSRCACMLSDSVVSDSVTSWTVAHQASLFMGLFQTGYWSRLSFPTPGDLPDPGLQPQCLACLALAGPFFTTAPPGKPVFVFPVVHSGFTFVQEMHIQMSTELSGTVNM